MIVFNLTKEIGSINRPKIPSFGIFGRVCWQLFVLVILTCAITQSSLGQESTASALTSIPTPVDSTTPPAAPAPTEPTPSQNTPLRTENYHLRSGDLIQITVFQEEDLKTEVRIPEGGAIMFPLIGSIQVKDKTVAEAQAQIRSLLAQKYIKDPEVTVAVIDYSKLWVTVLGEVQKPGNVELPSDSGLDLLSVIALSGGFTPNSEATNIQIRRMVKGQETIVNVNATDLSRNPGAKPCIILPGDAITVPYVKRWLTILGEVKTPGKVNLPTEGELDLLGAIALAGGYTPDADTDHIDIRRTVNGRDTMLTVNAKQLARDTDVKAFMVLAGDTITVKFAKQLITILGQVKTPGKVKIPPEGGLDLLGAIALAGGFTEEADTAHITVRRIVDGKNVILPVNAKKLAKDSSTDAFEVQPDDSISVPERVF